jgi:alanine racemase
MAQELKSAGYGDCMYHASATGGALLFPEAHFDMVRIGIGLYGYWPSEESRKAEKKLKIKLKPALVWKSIIAEVKKISKGSRVGYDGTEQVRRDTIMAVIPIGYWHGYDRGLSKVGEMLIRGKRAKVLGRISMDMTVIDVTDIPKVRVGDEVVLIGRQGKEAIFADELAAKINTTAYEFLTRINPLIARKAL